MVRDGLCELPPHPLCSFTARVPTVTHPDSLLTAKRLRVLPYERRPGEKKGQLSPRPQQGSTVWTERKCVNEDRDGGREGRHRRLALRGTGVRWGDPEPRFQLDLQGEGVAGPRRSEWPDVDKF